jgi:hypothetical protein
MTASTADARARSRRLAPEPVANWATLSIAAEVEIHRQGRPIASGRIDMRAPDGSVIWLIQDGGQGRALFLQSDGVSVFRRPRRHSPGPGPTRSAGPSRRF